MSISITVSGGASISNIPYTSGMNAQQALEGAYNTFTNPPNIPSINYWLEFFGSYQGEDLGYQVTMMDGTTQQGTNYWMLYVNNVLATKGIDQTTLNDGDEVEFKYEPYSDEVHGHTIMRQVHLARMER